MLHPGGSDPVQPRHVCHVLRMFLTGRLKASEYCGTAGDSQTATASLPDDSNEHAISSLLHHRLPAAMDAQSGGLQSPSGLWIQ